MDEFHSADQRTVGKVCVTSLFQVIGLSTKRKADASAHVRTAACRNSACVCGWKTPSVYGVCDGSACRRRMSVWIRLTSCVPVSWKLLTWLRPLCLCLCVCVCVWVWIHDCVPSCTQPPVPWVYMWCVQKLCQCVCVSQLQTRCCLLGEKRLPGTQRWTPPGQERGRETACHNILK